MIDCLLQSNNQGRKYNDLGMSEPGKGKGRGGNLDDLFLH